MSIKTQAVSTTAVACDETPFAAGFDCVVLNTTAGAINLTGCDTSGGTYTTIVSVPAGGMANATLTPYVKAASGTLYLLGSI